ncbi:MAG: transcriptional regulator [Moraxellaceae bacterium]|jgi:AcrR family transcriptional regulator|nr:transcriptional regulator [Moraxellaceae bacterium]MDF3031298.1 transcriptional regulator [Moraxellaceae bacterium]
MPSTPLIEAVVMRDQLLSALREAARLSAPELPGVAEVATLARVSEAEVREHLGPAENFPALLSHASPAHETRERIIASAARVFARKGFQKASLDEIAADAGMTKGAIYWHFRNKNDLLFAMLDCRLQRDTAPLMGDLHTLIREGGDPLTALTRMFQAGLHRCTDDPDWGHLYLECLSLSRNDGVREKLSAFYDRIWAMSGGFSQELQAHGLTHDGIDPKDAAVFWAALFDGLVLAWLIKGDEVDFDRLLPAIFRMLWRGIAPAAPTDNDKIHAPEIHHDA